MAMRQSSPCWERGVISDAARLRGVCNGQVLGHCREERPRLCRGLGRSMVVREAQAHAIEAQHRPRADRARPFSRSASLSTTLRVVPLSQEGED